MPAPRCIRPATADPTPCSRRRTLGIEGQLPEAPLVEDDDDSAHDDDAGPDNQAERRRSRPENPVDGEGPENGRVFEGSYHRGRGPPKRVRQPHLTQRPGEADSD